MWLDPRCAVERAPAQLTSTRAFSMGRPWKMPAQRTPECASCTVGVYGMDLRGGNVLALHCILWLAVPVATCSGSENHQAVQSQRKPTAEGFRLVTSPVSGWHPGRFARIGPSSSFSDQIECTPLTTFSTFSSLSATIGPTSKSTGTPPPWRMCANPTRPRVLSL